MGSAGRAKQFAGDSSEAPVSNCAACAAPAETHGVETKIENRKTAFCAYDRLHACTAVKRRLPFDNKSVMMTPMDSMKNKKAGSVVLLLLAAMIWGISFVAQSAGMEYIGPFTFTVVRSYIAALALIPCFLIFDRCGLSPAAERKTTWKAGAVLGIILFVGGNLQQVGILYTSVAKAGFITSLYIVFVPLFGVFFKQRVHPALFGCVLLAVAGLYFLSIRDDFSMSSGDLLVLGCSFVYAFHILAIDHFAGKADVVRMSCIQFFVVGTLSIFPMLLWEEPGWPGVAGAWLPLLYAGVMSGCFAYTMQMLGQRSIEPTTASLLLSPEAMFAALAGWLLLGQTLTQREMLGCALVFVAVVLSQLPWKRGEGQAIGARD